MCRTNELIVLSRSCSSSRQFRCSGIDSHTFCIDDSLISGVIGNRTTCSRRSSAIYRTDCFESRYIECNRINSLEVSYSRIDSVNRHCLLQSSACIIDVGCNLRKILTLIFYSSQRIDCSQCRCVRLNQRSSACIESLQISLSLIYDISRMSSVLHIKSLTISRCQRCIICSRNLVLILSYIQRLFVCIKEIDGKVTI